MKKYDVIAVGTGSAMNIVDALIRMEPDAKAAVIDKDEPGGICLTRACIPTKLLIYPADLVRTIQSAEQFGIDAEIRRLDFKKVMERMSSIVSRDIQGIAKSLEGSENVDYYRETAEFTGPYRLTVGGEEISSKLILLGLGSKPEIPAVEGLEETGYQTSDTIIHIRELPRRLTIIGGGYVAAEFGHFFSAMGSEVTILGRNSRFLPKEEPEVSELAHRLMSRHMKIATDQEILQVRTTGSGEKEVTARNRQTGEEKAVRSDEILLAAGRAPTTDLLHPERSGIELDKHGWVAVNEYLETTKRNIWALGDVTGRFLFKHVANYESKVVFYNAVLGEKIKADYHAVPHAVFCRPEIAAAGLGEDDAAKTYGEDGILIGFQRYERTAKGEAMGVRDCFVKVIVKEEFNEIVGAHIIGPDASVLIQELVNLMYTEDRSIRPITEGMHIHPSLSEVVDRAFNSLMTPHEYHHLLQEGWL